MELRGATCLVTGANRGIGLAIARRLAAHPVRLLLGARDPRRCPPLDPPPGGAIEVRSVAMDLSSMENIEASCASLGSDLDAIDVLVNNAGVLTAGLLEEQAIPDIYAMFQVNLVGLVHLTRRVLPGMLARRRGLIVNNASISAYAHLPTATTYAAAKAGVVAFTNALHRELRGTGVRTLQLVTPAVDTEMFRQVEATSGRYLDTSRWSRLSPDDWADQVVRGILHDARIVAPKGRTAVLRLAASGPLSVVDAIAARMFSRPLPEPHDQVPVP